MIRDGKMTITCRLESTVSTKASLATVILPKDFKPGTTVTLKATLYNATLPSQTLADFWVQFYKYNQTGQETYLGSAKTGPDGIATLPFTYPATGEVCVFYAYVSSGQKIMSSPVMLTVGRDTMLSMNVSKGGGYNHTVSGVLTCDGSPVAGRPVEVKVNGTSVVNVTTLADGTYSVMLNLKAVEDKPTDYQIETVFYGDSALNLTALDTLPNGTAYTVCTTLRFFGCKTTAHCTVLTVEPIIARATKIGKACLKICSI